MICIYISCSLLWILEIPTLYLFFLSVLVIEWCIFPFACWCCMLPTEISKCAGMSKEDSLLQLCSYIDLCWSPFTLVVHQSWWVKKRNPVAWRWKLVSDWFCWICERGEVGGHMSQSPLCGSEIKALRKETVWRSYDFLAGDREVWGPTWAWVTAHFPDFRPVVWNTPQPDTSLTLVFVR